MIKVGDLYRRIHGSQSFCQVVSLYNHTDIDPECPQSVAIIGMVKFVYMSGNDIGKAFKQKRADFSYKWEVVSNTGGENQ